MNKMKHDLEPWRGLILTIDSLLRWDKKFYPAIVFAAISIFYIFLWIMDLSTLTMLAVVGLFIMAFDFAYPTVSRFVFNTESWDGAQETRFEEVCNQLCSIKMAIGAWYEFVFSKEKKSTVVRIMFLICLCIYCFITNTWKNIYDRLVTWYLKCGKIRSWRNSYIFCYFYLIISETIYVLYRDYKFNTHWKHGTPLRVSLKKWCDMTEGKGV